jgi:hypothetical protein
MYAAVARAREVLAEEDLVLDQYTAFAQLLATFHEEDHHPDVRTHATPTPHTPHTTTHAHTPRHTSQKKRKRKRKHDTHDTQIP